MTNNLTTRTYYDSIEYILISSDFMLFIFYDQGRH